MTDNVPPDSKKKWMNRRRMAWICVGAGVTYPFLAAAFIPDTIVEKVTWAFYSFIGGIAFAYMGFTSVDQIWGKK